MFPRLRQKRLRPRPRTARPRSGFLGCRNEASSSWSGVRAFGAGLRGHKHTAEECPRPSTAFGLQPGRCALGQSEFALVVQPCGPMSQPSGTSGLVGKDRHMHRIVQGWSTASSPVGPYHGRHRRGWSRGVVGRASHGARSGRGRPTVAGVRGPAVAWRLRGLESVPAVPGCFHWPHGVWRCTLGRVTSVPIVVHRPSLTGGRRVTMPLPCAVVGVPKRVLRRVQTNVLSRGPGGQPCGCGGVREHS